MSYNPLPGGFMPTSPGSIRPVEFGTCAAIARAEACDQDAQFEVFLGAGDDSALWVPLCPGHLQSGPVDGLEYIVEVHGFLAAGAGLP